MDTPEHVCDDTCKPAPTCVCGEKLSPDGVCWTCAARAKSREERRLHGKDRARACRPASNAEAKRKNRRRMEKAARRAQRRK